MAELLVCFYFIWDLDFYKFVSLSLLSPFVEIAYMNTVDEMIQIIEKELLSGRTESISTGYRRYTEGYLDGLKAAKKYLMVPSDKEIEEMSQYLNDPSEI